MKTGVILMANGYPDDTEREFAGELMRRGYSIRFVRFKFYEDPDVVLESCHAVFSKHEKMLVPYKRRPVNNKGFMAETELIPSGDGAVVVPSGLPPLPGGFIYQEAGPRWKVIDGDGKQVGAAFFKKDAEDWFAKNFGDN